MHDQPTDLMEGTKYVHREFWGVAPGFSSRIVLFQ